MHASILLSKSPELALAINWKASCLPARVVRHQRLHALLGHVARLRGQRRRVWRKVIVITDQPAVREVNVSEVKVRDGRFGLRVVHHPHLWRRLRCRSWYWLDCFFGIDEVWTLGTVSCPHVWLRCALV